MRRSFGLVLGLGAAASAVLAAGGCVERKLVIRSDPPGAIVSLEDTVLEQRTPLEVPFDWDGVRRVTLQAPGYRTLQTTAAIDSRWYDWFPLDAFAQFLYPGTIRDVRSFDFKLEPYYPLDKALSSEQKADLRERMDALNERAEIYRAGGSEGPKSSPPASSSSAPPAGASEPPPPPLAPRNTAPATPTKPTKPPKPGELVPPAK